MCCGAVVVMFVVMINERPPIRDAAACAYMMIEDVGEIREVPSSSDNLALRYR